MTVLGIEIKLDLHGASFRPDEAKIAKWSKQIDGFLSRGKLFSGEASKLSGALQWGTQWTFRRMGRAMIRPIFKQIRDWNPCIKRELSLALRWWQEVLAMGICEHREWYTNASKPLHLYSDARSTPPRIAAVLIGGGSIQFADMQPDVQTLDCFKRGGDGQIMSLELLSIALGISVWAKELAGKNVIIYSDNTGAEAATRNGTACALLLRVRCVGSFLVRSEAQRPISIRVPWCTPCGANLQSCALVFGWSACPLQRILLIHRPGNPMRCWNICVQREWMPFLTQSSGTPLRGNHCHWHRASKCASDPSTRVFSGCVVSVFSIACSHVWACL